MLLCVKYHTFLDLNLPDFWEKAWLWNYSNTSKPQRLLTSTDTPPKANLLTVDHFTNWNFIYTMAIAIDDSRTGGQSYKATAYRMIAIKPTPKWLRSSITMPRCAFASPGLCTQCMWQTIKSGQGILDTSCICVYWYTVHSTEASAPLVLLFSSVATAGNLSLLV